MLALQRTNLKGFIILTMKLSRLLAFALAITITSCKKAENTDSPVVPPAVPKSEFKWAKTIGGPGQENPPHLTTDDAGNVYLMGTFTGTADFDPGAGVQNLTSAGRAGVYLAKYNKEGAFVFVKNITVAGAGYFDLGADAAGNIYIGGNITGKVDIDPGPGIQTLDSKGGVDIFVVKYDTNGNVLSKFIIGNSRDERLNAMAVDGMGNCFLGGSSNYVVDMDPGPLVQNLSYPTCFLAKYDAAGNHVFHKNISTFAGWDDDIYFPSEIVLATDKDGAVYAASNFFSDDYYNTIPNRSADKNKYSVSLIKFDASGNYVYATPYDYGPNYHLYHISVDDSKKICITGYHDEERAFFVVFDNAGKKVFYIKWDAPNVVPLAFFDNMGNIHAIEEDYKLGSCIVTYKPDGTRIAIHKQDIPGYLDFSRSKTGFYVAGIFAPTADLDFSEGVDIHTSVGSSDVFFGRYDVK